MNGVVDEAERRLRGVAVLVTGGAGFIGTNLVRRLAAAGSRVRVLDDFSNGLRSNLEGVDVEIVEGDVRDAAAVSRAAAGCDLVSHQAALGSVPRSMEDPVATLDVNVMGTAQVLDAARRAGARRIVIASSSSVYGDETSDTKKEGREGSPLSPYAVSKAACEVLARGHVAAFGQDVACLRYFNVYGPWQRPDSPYAAVIPLFVRALATGVPPTIFGDGLQLRDFTYVEDVVDANVLALASPAPLAAAPLNIARGRATTLLELWKALTEVTGRRDVDVHFAPERPGDIRSSCADTSRAFEALGFRAGRTLEEGLRETVRWSTLTG